MEQEDKQAVFNYLREMANNTLSVAYPGTSYVQYPWEAIDRLQASLEASYDAGDKETCQKMVVAVDTLLAWRNALVSLGNVQNIPELEANDWWTDKYQL
ncbi:hypothetical protein [Lactiplantibacillus plantarum]|uniref:hypothetical protein n=1 Tax=Lactiplantibacillus plantarum TaxID=1590 RepID=UPI000976A1C0|nr:hypothetical protein [Lactiplantibacillus plantarum]